MWRAFQLAAPSLSLPDEYEDIRYESVYPWSVKPDNLVTHRDLMSWYRDWYAGTKYDMTQGLQAGPFGTPDRYTTNSSVKGHWERSIALYRTNFVHVQHLRHPDTNLPESTASVVWYGAGPAHYAPFLPIPIGATQSLGPLKFANPNQFEHTSMNWAVRKVMDICQIRWDRMHLKVEAAQKEIEEAGGALTTRLRSNASGGRSLNEAIEAHAQNALQVWHKLAMDLIFNFSDNTDIQTMTPLGYPDDWLRGVGYQDGPPDVPVEDQCPPDCPSSSSSPPPSSSSPRFLER
jgi:dipeptidase